MAQTYTRRLTDKMRAAVVEHSMLDGTSSLLIALSGGSDSVTLLFIMRQECAARGITLSAAHINHMIRGEEADRDEMFCRSLCEKLDIPLYVLREDVPALASRHRISIEEAAREVRYGFFDRLCREKGIDKIATAHNARDNAETLLFNLVRGSGVRGLGGIPPVRGNIIRPLIGCDKELILGCIAENGLEYVTDSTNSDNSYTRNYIRNDVLPMLEKLNPAFCAAAGRLSDAARQDCAYLDSLAEKLPDCLGAEELKQLPEPLMRRYILRFIASHGGGEAGMPEAVHLDAVVRLIRDWRGGEKRASLPGITIMLDAAGLRLSPEKCSVPPFGEDLLRLPHGTIYRGGSAIQCCPASSYARLCIQVCEQCGKDLTVLKNIYKKSINITIASDRIKGIVSVSARLPGDRIKLRGLNRSVRKLMNEAAVPPDIRGSIPIFRDEEGILWIPGIGVRDGAAVDDKNPGSGTCALHWFYGEAERRNSKSADEITQGEQHGRTQST
ncbi:MAG: tRNA lysidine(34) synthetase TilS [Clostridiales bacterium]|nr:tRNA lysidine(34) synthetase TilS [Clostridiales bacterium]